MRLALGGFTFDDDSRQLLRGQNDIHLSPKAFDLLKALIDARPRVLTKHELQRHLWPDTFVSESNLASLVAEIREALSDSARAPRFIRTAQRVGYAFCGPADPAAPATASAAGSTFCWLIKDGGAFRCASARTSSGATKTRAAFGSIRQPCRGGTRASSCQVAAPSSTISAARTARFCGEHRSRCRAPLSDGDEIRVGSVVVHFRMASGSRTATWTES